MKKIRIFLNNNKKIIEIIVICAIIILSLYLRFYDFPNRIVWNSDVGRDMLIAKLISEGTESSVYGHFNSGNNYFYPNYYFNFLGFIFYLLRDETLVIGLLIILQCISLVFLYGVAKLNYDRVTSLITTFFYAISYFAINSSHFPISAHFSLIFFLPSFFLLFLYIKKKKIKHLVVSTILLAITTTIFYGSLLFIPIYIAVLLAEGINDDLQRIIILKSIGVFVILFIVTFLVLYFPLIVSDGFSSLFSFSHVTSIRNVNPVFVLNRMLEVYKRDFSILFYNLPTKNHLTYSIPIFISLFFLFRNQFVRILVGIIGIHYLSLIFISDFLSHYFILLMPIYFLLLGGVIYEIKKPRYGLVSVCIFFTGICFLLVNSIFFNTSKIYDYTYKTHKKFVTIVNEKYPNDLILSTNSAFMRYESRIFWYFQSDQFDFVYSRKHPMIKEPQTGDVIYVCQVYEFGGDAHCKKNLVNGVNLVEIIKVVDSSFYIFK